MRTNRFRSAWTLFLLLLPLLAVCQQSVAPPKSVSSQTVPLKNIRVYLVGDSTMSIKEVKAYPETGWGMPFVYFFDSTVTVDNRAKNGRSTKTFLSDKLWQPVVDNLQDGDYVFIQFGHNDEAKEKTER